MNTSSVCAVVVTFNRKDLLKKCLDPLLAQTFKPTAIVLSNR
jgi:Glycosyl transferase family 2.